MTDELLPYYSRELAFLRKMGARFAEQHPTIAGRLRMSGETIEDPHVSRMIEAVAYLNARTRFKIEDDFPEITEALLNVLYPHFLAPFPSAAIVQFELNRSQVGLTSGHSVAMDTSVETDPVRGAESFDGEICRFRTCYPVVVWPMDLKVGEFQGQPFSAPLTPFTRDAIGVIRLELEAYSPESPFSDYSFDTLRFYLNGDGQYIHDLFECIFNNALGVAIASSPSDRNPIIRTADCLKPVGFARDEGLIDYTARSFLGYRLLTEYFAFPEKFRFVDIEGFTRQDLQRFAPGERLGIYIYVNRHSHDLESNVGQDTFLLGCTPIINLYRQRAEPIALTHETTEYHIDPDRRHPQAHEVYAINRVTAVSAENDRIEYFPFYSHRHHDQDATKRRFWHASRRSNAAADVTDDGSEVFLTLTDLDFNPTAPTGWTLDVETTCLNRDLPGRLPFGGGQPVLRADSGGMTQVRCVTPPTQTLRPKLRRGRLWQLISHLTLNHVSLVDGEGGADALREIIKLCDLVDSAATRDVVKGLTSIEARRVVGRVSGAVASGFCRGVEARLHFDEDRFTGQSIYLFAAVLDRFLGLYSSINSFTKTVATTNRREEVLCDRWPPRVGEKILL